MSKVIWALVDQTTEVHAVPGRVTDGSFRSDQAHDLHERKCDCAPTVEWNTAAAPRPLYTHRNRPAAPLSATCDWVTHASMPKHARSHE